MRLKVLGSSSAGNCYILQNDKEALIIECGVKMDKIKQGLNFNTAKVCGCLVSHEHLDHCKSVSDVIKSGIKVFATQGTFQAMNIDTNHHRSFVIHPEIEFNIGSFKVLPFTVHHDAEQPVGFMINHPETGNILFVTDTYYVENKFKGLNNILIEANYCHTILNKKLADGATPEFLRNRIFKSHMSLATCKETLRANDLSKVNNIVLIHLSEGNSDAKRFQREVQETTGKNVHVAEPGLIIENFHKQPF